MMSISRTNERKLGFTLLEVLAALSLAAVLATALAGSFHIGFRARRTAEGALLPVRNAALALEQLKRDVECATPPEGILAGEFIGYDTETMFDDSDASLLVMQTLNEDMFGGAHGIRKVEYALLRSDSDNNHKLVRRVTANLLALVTPEPLEEVLCRQVVALALRYYDGSEWQDSWDSTTRGNMLPSAIEAVLELRVSEPERISPSESDIYLIRRVFILPCTGSADDPDQQRQTRGAADGR